MPAVLQRLMRHAEVATTMKYYVTMDADSVADELWGKDWDSGNTYGNQCPATPRKTEGAPDATTSETPSGEYVTQAEGKGFEPSTGCPAPDFESSGNLTNARKNRGFRVVGTKIGTSSKRSRIGANHRRVVQRAGCGETGNPSARRKSGPMRQEPESRPAGV